MKVYLCYNRQKRGEHAVCASLKRAKEWLLESLARTAGDDGIGGQWDGWAWWTDYESRICFGENPATQKHSPPIAEGTITELDLLA